MMDEDKQQTKKFTSCKTVNILPDPQFHRHYEQSISDDQILDELKFIIEHRLPELGILDGEPIEYRRGTKFLCTIKDILTSDGEFWVEREFYLDENERKFRQMNEILSLFATSYESLKNVYVGQLVALYYESTWHRALVVSKSDSNSSQIAASARVRLVDNGASLYVNVGQLKWLPEQFYLFPFKALECVFSEAVKPTFSDTVRLTFKQLVANKRLRATVFDRDGTRLCILLKCQTDEGLINVYRYLRAHEHKSHLGRMLPDGDIVSCLRETIVNHSQISFDHSLTSSKTLSVTLPILSPPSPLKLTRTQWEKRRAELQKISASSIGSSPLSAETIITPLIRHSS